jgi:hypothetical protein
MIELFFGEHARDPEKVTNKDPRPLMDHAHERTV